jgi:hypothetical protein
MKSKSAVAVPILNTMSIENLRGVAKAAGVKCGKSKKDTINNLIRAIDAKAVHFKSAVTLSVNPAKPGEPTRRKTLFAATFRTYTSGPGEENSVWITPDAPVAGSPSEP